MKTLRNCCSCLVLIILAILFTCIALTYLAITPKQAKAQGFNAECPNALSVIPEQAIEITAGIQPPPAANIARGIFLTTSVSLDLRGGECVILAPDRAGNGLFWVDDEMEIRIIYPDGHIKSWTRDFRSIDQARVNSLAPQNISLLFGQGKHSLQITLRDLSPTVYGASPIWLVIFAAPTPMPTMLPTWTPTAAASILTTVLTPTRVLDRPVTGALSPTTEDTKSGTIIAPLVFGVCVIIAIIIVQRVKRRGLPITIPILDGTLEIFDEKTFEPLTLELVDWQKGFDVLGDPLRVAPRVPGKDSLVRAIPCVDVMHLEIPNQANAEPVILHRGETTRMGSLRFSFQDESEE